MDAGAVRAACSLRWGKLPALRPPQGWSDGEKF
jgi:hypothetical protein